MRKSSAYELISPISVCLEKQKHAAQGFSSVPYLLDSCTGSLGSHEALTGIFILLWVCSVSDYVICAAHASVALLEILSQKPLFLCAS